MRNAKHEKRELTLQEPSTAAGKVNPLRGSRVGQGRLLTGNRRPAPPLLAGQGLDYGRRQGRERQKAKAHPILPFI